MTYTELEKVNKTIKTTNIKGKEYAEVNQRIKAFRMLYPNGTIATELLKDENGICTFAARVYDGEVLLGTGHAQEKEDSSYINKQSYIENCETSAVGRALGMLGIGIDTSVASADEISNAINNQTISEAQAKALTDLAQQKGVNIDDILKKYKLKALTDMKGGTFAKVIEKMRGAPDAC